LHFAQLQKRYDRLIRTIRAKSQHFGRNDWINHRPQKGAANLVLCEGGFGDGTYHCFVGLTPAGRVARLVIDFDIAGPTEH
jgi:hypothetical protein